MSGREKIIGYLDAAAIQHDAVTILLNRRNGTLGPSGAGPISLGYANLGLSAAADWDGDGNLDLAVTSYNDNKMIVLWGHADGSFNMTDSIVLTTSGNAQSVAAADFDHDGKLDLAVGVHGGTRESFVQLFQGAGGRQFTDRPGWQMGRDTNVYVVTGDFDGDGHPDVATASYSGLDPSGTATLQIWPGNGTWRFAPGSLVRPSAVPHAIAAGDFNGDSLPDLAAANTDDDSVTVALTSTIYGFDLAAAQELTPGATAKPGAVATADVNGDGYEDLLVANFGTRTASIYLGQHGWTFDPVPYATLSTPEMPYAVLAADLNNDGLIDAAVGNGTQVSVFLQNAQSQFGAAIDTVVTDASRLGTSMALSDFDRNGVLDLAVTQNPSQGNSGTVSVLLGNGDGRFTAKGGPIPTGSLARSVAVADFNNDRNPDLAVANSSGGNVVVLLGNGGGTFDPNPVSLDAESNPESVVAADFDGDGNMDIAVGVRNGGSPSLIYAYKGDGSGTSFKQTLRAMLKPNWNREVALTVGDFDGDNVPDLAIASYDPTYASTTSDLRVWRGNGQWVFTQAALLSVEASPTSVAVADLNGDSIPDLAVASQSGTVSVVLSQPSAVATVTVPGVSAVGTGPHEVVAFYEGDPTTANPYAQSESAGNVMLEAQKARPQVTLDAPAHAVQGVGLRLTAKVDPPQAQAHEAGGTVDFYNGTTRMAIGVPLIGGAAVYLTQVGDLAPGETNVLTVRYSGDANFQAAESPPVDVRVQEQRR